ncbi:MAG TPA: hypothetical protein VGW35_00295 [Methylomirabilota bacterium]|nr:hypothetical protein [Methylomirabilota bacterium]
MVGDAVGPARALGVSAAAGTSTGRVGLSVLAGASVGWTAALALALAAGSLGWPLVHDAPLMHYIATRILEGAVPYRDVFDMNFPGVYLAHLLGLGLFGRGDAGFRAFDLLVLGGTALGLAVGLQSFGRWAIAAAAALFGLYHLAGGAWRAGQRDFILCLPLAWMLAAAMAYLRSGRPRWLALAGVGLGTAVWIKPHAGLLAPVLVTLAWRRPPGERWPALASLALGLGLPAVGIAAWLGAAGGLGPFLDIVGGYVLPLYSRLGRESLVTAVLGHDLGVAVLAGLGLWTLGGWLLLDRAARAEGRRALLAATVAYGALHFALQGKGWEYHLYPFALFAVASGAAGLGDALRRRRRHAAGALLAVLVLTATVLGVKGWWNLEPAWIAEKSARAHALARTLAPLSGDRTPVQVLDTTDGGIHALYLLGLRQPTRFIYDFHFYHDVDRPYVQRLRAELMAELRRRPPAAVVLFERGWPSGDYDRVEAFPALAGWLEAGYRLAEQGDGYRVYAARRDR